MIEAENLTKYYGPVKAIEDVSFTVEKGEIVGFLGPNGAGKSTTLRILTGFMPATSGRAMVAGYDVFKNSLEVRKRIGYLPEIISMYPEMRVKSYLDFVASVKGLRGREKTRRIGEVIERCRIREVARKPISALSRGYKQRVGMAQALLNDPEVLFFDEPTAGMDPAQVVEIRQLIKELAGARTLLISTHILPEANMLCQRVMIINRGRIVAVGTPHELAERLQRATRLLIRVAGPSEAVLPVLERVNGVVHVSRQDSDSDAYLIEAEQGRDVRDELARAVGDHHWGILELRSADMTLEEVFINLVVKEEGVEE